jgi:hypothetical protein
MFPVHVGVVFAAVADSSGFGIGKFEHGYEMAVVGIDVFVFLGYPKTVSDVAVDSAVCFSATFQVKFFVYDFGFWVIFFLHFYTNLRMILHLFFAVLFCKSNEIFCTFAA